MGRQSFVESANRFSDVLIDEACQASETTTLQPIMYECRHCVMVGDPQQLPAAILSQYGKNKHFEKSMFERMMQAGCSVRVLNTQYRMHPNIRKYPSNRFYQGKLLDGKTIANISREFFYSHPLLKPYVLFDVIKGVEKKECGSVYNSEEAIFALSLIIELKKHLLNNNKTKNKKKIEIGVITPYSLQKKYIKNI